MWTMLRAGALNLEIESKWDSFEHFPIPEFRTPIRCDHPFQRTFFTIFHPLPLSKNIPLPGLIINQLQKMMYGLVEIDHVDELGGEQMNYNLGLDKNLDTRAQKLNLKYTHMSWIAILPSNSFFRSK